MKAPRFTIGAMLLTVGIVAVGISVWQFNFKARQQITFAQSSRIKPGMTRFQAQWTLGPPARVRMENGAIVWMYEFAKQTKYSPDMYEFRFGKDGKVFQVSPSFYLKSFGSPWPQPGSA